jgi:hypothetical protein
MTTGAEKARNRARMPYNAPFFLSGEGGPSSLGRRGLLRVALRVRLDSSSPSEIVPLNTPERSNGGGSRVAFAYPLGLVVPVKAKSKRGSRARGHITATEQLRLGLAVTGY